MALKVAEPLLLAWIGRRIEPSWILGIPALDYAVLTTAAWALGGEMVEYKEGAKPGQDNRCRTSSTPQASRHAGTVETGLRSSSGSRTSRSRLCLTISSAWSGSLGCCKTI